MGHEHEDKKGQGIRAKAGAWSILGALLLEKEGPEQTSPNRSCEADDQSIVQWKKCNRKKIVADGPKAKQATDEKQPPPASSQCQPRTWASQTPNAWWQGSESGAGPQWCMLLG